MITSIISDTLKKDGKWSRTSLTMWSAWIIALYSYLYDLWKNGFNETAFYALVGVALGAKVTDAWGKKMNPEPKQPNEEVKP